MYHFKIVYNHSTNPGKCMLDISHNESVNYHIPYFFTAIPYAALTYVKEVSIQLKYNTKVTH
jgi:hypothetical protein